MISVHWLPTHRGAEDAQRFARWKPPFVKIVCIDEKPPYTEDIPPGAMIVIRNHPMSEMYGLRGLGAAAGGELLLDDTQDKYLAYFATVPDNRYAWRPTTPNRAGFSAYPATASATDSPEVVGAQHAAACNRMAAYCESKGVARGRLLFEGLNEPQLWANEPPTLTARYYRAFLIALHSYGLRGVVGNFGVGWPGNGGVQDAPVDWAFWNPVIAVFQPGDYLGLHEYWALNGPQQNWRWWGGRFLQCPFNVPILITECGIDTGVAGQWYGGWYDLPGSSSDVKAVRYVDELWWYGNQCAADGRVKGIFPFTYDIGGNEWEKFDIRSEPFFNAFWHKLDAEGLPGGDDVIVIPPDGDGDGDGNGDVPPPPVVVSEYKIVAAVTDVQPQAAPYVTGVNYMVDAAGQRVKPMQKPVEVTHVNTPKNVWMMEVSTTGAWAFTPAQMPAGSDWRFRIRTVDAVRGIDSGWHVIDLEGVQVKMEFVWTPVEQTEPDVPPVPTDPIQAVRNAAWNALGIPYNPDAAFSKWARNAGLGNPVTSEYAVGGYTAQGYAGAIVYCKTGDWGNIFQLAW